MNKKKIMILFVMLLGTITAISIRQTTSTKAAPPQAITPKKHLFPSASQLKTNTPIKYVVVIFQENNSFDRYFGIYPHAQNPLNEPIFMAQQNTPRPNGLTPALIQNNPNSIKPYRLSRNQAPCSNNHEYLPEIAAYNHGLMNRFVEETGNNTPGCAGQVMGYYDGNAITALWNYAQHYALNDNTYTTYFGPSTPGALSLVAGITGPAKLYPLDALTSTASYFIHDSIVGDPNPVFDDCSYKTSASGSGSIPLAQIMQGKNIGDLLNQKNIRWGWFQKGFSPDQRNTQGGAICNTRSRNYFGVFFPDYIPHHEPFNYYASTANPHHLPPSTINFIGSTDRANHQYDLSDFWKTTEQGELPAVSYLKAPAYQDGHAGYSDPIDEQHFLVETINRLQQLPQWKEMAIIIIYDDTDGDYDHQIPPQFANHKETHQGFGGRIPMLIISPWSKVNFIDHSLLDQSSVAKFIEYNWGLPFMGENSKERYAGSLLNMFDFSQPKTTPLLLDPITGNILHS